MNTNETSSKLHIKSAMSRKKIKELLPTAKAAAQVISLISYGDGSKLVNGSRARYQTYIAGLDADATLNKLRVIQFERKFVKSGVRCSVNIDLVQALRELHQIGELDRLYSESVSNHVFSASHH